MEEDVTEVNDEEGGRVDSAVYKGVACGDVSSKEDERGEGKDEHCTH